MPERRRVEPNPDGADQLPEYQDGRPSDPDRRPPPPPGQDRADDRRDVDPDADTRRQQDARDPRYDDPHDPRDRRYEEARDARHDSGPSTRQRPDDGYTGRDWRDDDHGGVADDRGRAADDRGRAADDRSRGGSTPATDIDHDRRDVDDDDRLSRPSHAGAGPAGTAGRSSSWGPVLSGAATAFVVFLIFSALWVAIAASGADAVGDNLAWFQLISGVLAAAAGGAAAGWLDPRGTMTGMIQGLSTWGLLVLATTITGLTTGTALLGAVGNVTVEANIEAANVTEMLQPFEMELWALFAALLGGALIAGLAGALTGRAHTMLALDDEHPVVDDHRAAARSGSRRR